MKIHQVFTLIHKKYGTHTESRILHLHKIFYSANPYMQKYEKKSYLSNNQIEKVQR